MVYVRIAIVLDNIYVPVPPTNMSNIIIYNNLLNLTVFHSPVQTVISAHATNQKFQQLPIFCFLADIQNVEKEWKDKFALWNDYIVNWKHEYNRYIKTQYMSDTGCQNQRGKRAAGEL